MKTFTPTATAAPNASAQVKLADASLAEVARQNPSVGKEVGQLRSALASSAAMPVGPTKKGNAL